MERPLKPLKTGLEPLLTGYVLGRPHFERSEIVCHYRFRIHSVRAQIVPHVRLFIRDFWKNFKIEKKIRFGFREWVLRPAKAGFLPILHYFCNDHFSRHLATSETPKTCIWVYACDRELIGRRFSTFQIIWHLILVGGDVVKIGKKISDFRFWIFSRVVRG